MKVATNKVMIQWIVHVLNSNRCKALLAERDKSMNLCPLHPRQAQAVPEAQVTQLVGAQQVAPALIVAQARPLANNAHL